MLYSDTVHPHYPQFFGSHSSAELGAVWRDWMDWVDCVCPGSAM